MRDDLNRRELFVWGAGLAGVGIGKAGQKTAPPFSNERMYGEAAQNIPIEEKADVVVCGSGPAGVAAAIAAAHTGANTRLLEVNGCLGGVWTAGLLCWILDMKDKPGLLQEIMSRLTQEKAGYVNQPGYSFAYDAEPMKWLLEHMYVTFLCVP
jgi:NADPH-dependent 2,4-dienoyl-CoA reductase/sulfur reductase-like enzyme